MSELHKFLFDGLPVRGMLVRLTGAWAEILRRRAANTATGAYAVPVRELLGEMTAAGVLMQGSIQFDGALVMQIFGDGPVKVAVAEVQPDLSLRATATLVGGVPEAAALGDLINAHGRGRCAMTLDPRDKLPGRQAYQSMVPLVDADGRRLQNFGAMVEHYLRQSEQLDTRIVLAADDHVAAGLLVQRMPLEGQANLGGGSEEADEHFNRIATLAASLTREELLTLDADTILRRLFWEEKLVRFEPRAGIHGPHFACTCSRERVAAMIRGLGREEADSIVAERGDIEVGCEFCGAQYRFDAVDAQQIFTGAAERPPGTQAVQ
ncbi:Hsp33 family molecular chaperone HslO [Xylophilus sp.]|uniref:Hsp33 family molecular chaperone HslO n=1 Tax=Xylophilus sp. TaxID=2653893 RepID=UPI0013BCD18C|nr:Hsp33 family molecular chaperone HslO [Xylophilus sp.]KAF1048094.1 MAG: 33 kDa chaperonin [Xylophilus sp.]